MKYKVHLIIGTRPNLMKIAPLYNCLRSSSFFEPILINTGQHYDYQLYKVIQEEFNLCDPDYELKTSLGSHSIQTASIITLYEAICFKDKPDLVIVPGDVNSSLACALVAKKLKIKIAHLEAGLRSWDMDMPEEINRVLIDSIADILWAPSNDATRNLLNAGVSANKIIFVGNIMIDSLKLLESKIENSKALTIYKLTKMRYALVILHRPENVDDAKRLLSICKMLSELSKTIKLVISLHPRTQHSLLQNNLLPILESQDIIVLGALAYCEFINLVKNARFVVTDSGGLQEETTYLKIPCLTLRKNTERPITISEGTNQLVDIYNIFSAVNHIISGSIFRRLSSIEYWDGNAAFRVVESLQEFCQQQIALRA